MNTVGSRPCPVQTDWDRVHGAQLLGNALEDILTDVCTLIPTAGTINLTVAGTLGVSGVTTLSGNLATTANVTFTLGATEAFTLTCTDISAPLVMTNTITTAAKTGARALFNVKTNVAMGAWCNAIKGHMEFTGTSGRTTGLASGICAELTVASATLGSGNYYCFEAELNPGASTVTNAGGTQMGFMYMSVNTNTADFLDHGYIFKIAGLGSAASSHVFQANTDQPTHALRIMIDSTPYFLLMTSVNNGTQ